MNKQLIKDTIKVIIIDDDEDIRINTVDALSAEFPLVEAYESPKDLINSIHQHFPAVIVTDLRMPDSDGLEFYEQVRAIDQNLPVILMTAYGDISLAVDAIKQGIYDFIEKPFQIEILLETIHRAIEKRFLTLSLDKVQQKLNDSQKIENQIIGYASTIKHLRQDVLDLAEMNVPVMIYGETGTGKELVARCLHDYSPRRQHHFVPLNCAAIPEHLAEAELFGYIKGAFTDAKAARKGKLEFAKGGTLFLDEVESLSLNIQAKLLRALSDNIITPLGSNDEIPIDCRIISASKEDLRNNENFRQDLFFRLQVAEIKLPPLRERSNDIIHLFEIFTLQNCDKLGTNYLPLPALARDKLMQHPWSGNVRELINVSTRYAIKQCADIDYALESQETFIPKDYEEKSLKERVEYYESSIIKSKLQEHKGKVGKVLKELSIERRTFNQKLNKYGISSNDYKEKD